MVWLVDEAALPKPAIMVLLNLALIAGDALVRGGQLDIGAELRDDGNVEIVVRGQGPRIVLDPELRAALTGTLDNPVDAPPAAAAYIAASLAAEYGGTVKVSDTDAEILMFCVQRAGKIDAFTRQAEYG